MPTLSECAERQTSLNATRPEIMYHPLVCPLAVLYNGKLTVCYS